MQSLMSQLERKPKDSIIKHIGFWRTSIDEESELPFPIISTVEYKDGFVKKCKQWKQLNETMTQYFASLTMRGSMLNDIAYVEYWGNSKCRLCGIVNECGEYVYNNFRFPAGIFHYVVEHNIMIDEEFQDMIIKYPLLNPNSLNVRSMEDNLLRLKEGFSALRYS